MYKLQSAADFYKYIFMKYSFVHSFIFTDLVLQKNDWRIYLLMITEKTPKTFTI